MEVLDIAPRRGGGGQLGARTQRRRRQRSCVAAWLRQHVVHLCGWRLEPRARLPLRRHAAAERSESLSQFSQAHLDKVAKRLNERPRKTLGFITPADKLLSVLQ